LLLPLFLFTAAVRRSTLLFHIAFKRTETMIIMINGAYGVGKTTVANRLVGLITNSMLFDPEEVGFMLRSIIPEEIRQHEEKTDNFQDLELWKVLTVQVADLLKMKYGKHLIVPMTIIHKDYFRYIFNGFKEIDEQTYHFCLIAKHETIHERLRKRGEIEGNWCFQQVQKCVEAHQDKCFEEHIMTDGVSVEEIAAYIGKRIDFLAGTSERALD
jgi:chloramphenicol 3-O-phosphotransferase